MNLVNVICTYPLKIKHCYLQFELMLFQLKQVARRYREQNIKLQKDLEEQKAKLPKVLTGIQLFLLFFSAPPPPPFFVCVCMRAYVCVCVFVC